MIAALVKYEIYIEESHPMLDGYYSQRSKVVEVEKLTDLNKEFKRIIDIKIL